MPIAFLRRLIWLFFIAACGESRFAGEAIKFSIEENSEVQGSETEMTVQPPMSESPQPPTLTIPENTSGSYLVCVLKSSETGEINCQFDDDSAAEAADRKIIMVELIIDDGTVVAADGHSLLVDQDGAFTLKTSSELSAKVRVVVAHIGASELHQGSLTVIARISGPGQWPQSETNELPEQNAIESAIRGALDDSNWKLNFANSKRDSSLISLLPANLLYWKLHSGWDLGGQDDNSDGQVDDDSQVVPKDGYIEFRFPSNGVIKTRNHWPSSGAYCNGEGQLREEIEDVPEAHPSVAAYQDFIFNAPHTIDVDFGVEELQPNTQIACAGISSDTNKQCGMAIEHVFDIGGSGSGVLAMKIRFGMFWVDNGSPNAHSQRVFVARAARPNENGNWVPLFEQPLSKPMNGLRNMLNFKFTTDPSNNRIRLKVTDSAADFSLQYSDSDRISLRSEDLCKVSTNLQTGVRVNAMLRRLWIHD